MSDYYLHAIVLEGCPYSNAALELLNEHKNIKTQIIKVNQTNKDNYKTTEIGTFPQIYLKRNNKNGSLLLGGYDKLEKFFDTFYFNKYSQENVKQYINDKWSKKSVLRLIELINTK